MGASRILAGFALALLAHTCSAASKVDHHTVKMHTAFIKNRGDGDFTMWKEAFVTADNDKDGLIPVHEAPRIFKDHYNLVHMKDSGRGAASEIHYMDDGVEFAKMVMDTKDWQGAKLMTYDEFLDALHEYVAIKHKERGALYDMAASIF